MTIDKTPTGVVIDDGSIVDIIRRPFDQELGDDRRFTLEEAIDLAAERASKTAVRQVISSRPNPARDDDHIVPRYLVQAI